MSEAGATHYADMLVFGGGIAGLWLARTLHEQGFSVLLLSRGALGRGQTLWSQGIVHGGVKYVLQGGGNPIFDTIPAMPQRWRDHLAGARQPDLSGAETLLDTYYLLSDGRPWSKMRSFLGSRLLHGKIARVPGGERPSAFAGSRGALYSIRDLVLDVPSVVERLAAPLAAYDIGQLEPAFTRDADGWQVRLGGESIRAQSLVLAAGEGNEALVRQTRIRGLPMQRRVFEQITLHGERLPEVYAHCIGGGFSAEPDITITTHAGGPRGRWWSLGGRIATAAGESGDGETARIRGAEKLLRRFFPKLQLDGADWKTVRIAAAEPEAGGVMPHHPVCHCEDGVLLCWPVKLTLTPLLGDMLLEQLRAQGIVPRAGGQVGQGTEAQVVENRTAGAPTANDQTAGGQNAGEQTSGGRTGDGQAVKNQTASDQTASGQTAENQTAASAPIPPSLALPRATPARSPWDAAGA